jgi:hypothetical protein
MEEPIVEIETEVDNDFAVMRAVFDRVRAATSGKIRDLEVNCDGEVLTIRGEVDDWEVWWLAFHATWVEARAGEGLLFDVQVEVVPRGE